MKEFRFSGENVRPRGIRTSGTNLAKERKSGFIMKRKAVPE
jgi:hypothetical protein